MADVEVEKSVVDHVMILRLNRPDSLNALTDDMRRTVDEAIAEFTADRAMRVAVVTGTGRAFCAGADLTAIAKRSATPGASHVPNRGPRFPFGTCPKPVIAAINGLCVGGGVEVVADCDLRIASEDAYFGLFEAQRGIVARSAVVNLPRLMPLGEAMNLLVTGRRMSAQRAYQIGFVQELAPADELMARALEMARDVAKSAPGSVEAAKSIVQLWRHYAVEDIRESEEALWPKISSSPDALEGVRAFVEKRAPEWTD